MEIKYFNSNFDKITQNKDTDQSITNVIEKLPSLNIISDKNLLEGYYTRDIISIFMSLSKGNWS